MAIKAVYQMREAIWQPPEKEALRPPPQDLTPQKRKQGGGQAWEDNSPPPQPHPKGRGKGKNGKALGKLMIMTMGKDTPLCPDFQYARCSAAQPGGSCPKGKHLCARKVKADGRVCGGKHPGSRCMNSKRIQG